MKKTLWFFTLIIILIFTLVIFIFQEKEKLPKTISIANQKFQVFEANEQIAWAKGLSGVKSLKNNQGMLFIFPKAE